MRSNRSVISACSSGVSASARRAATRSSERGKGAPRNLYRLSSDRSARLTASSPSRSCSRYMASAPLRYVT